MRINIESYTKELVSLFRFIGIESLVYVNRESSEISLVNPEQSTIIPDYNDTDSIIPD